MSYERLETDVPAIPLVRMYSGSHAAVCCCLEDLDCDDAANNVRLGCGCAYHFACLVQYIHSELGDRRKYLGKRGINCANTRISCVQTDYSLTPEDLDTIVLYQTSNNINFDGFEGLTHADALQLRRWIEGNSEKVQSVGEAAQVSTRRASTSISAPVVDNSLDLIYATTKPCPGPGCKNRASHFHGHACHHIWQGCSSCQVKYCFLCLCTAAQNMKERGAENRCKCGGWSSFCKPLNSSRDIKNFLVLDPYPYDKRCGCQVCNECRPGHPCGTCSGNCVVCSGWLNPGPVEIGNSTKWIPQTTAMEKRSRDAAGDVERNPEREQIEEQFIEACWRGDEDSVNAALTAGVVNVNRAQSMERDDGMKALHVAAAIGHEALARRLVRAGSSIFILDAENNTPLHIIAHDINEVGFGEGHMRVARFLIQANVPYRNVPNTDLFRRQNNDGYTALDIAVRHANVTLAQVLLAESKHIQLDRNAHHLFTEAIDSRSGNMVRLLLEAKLPLPGVLLEYACKKNRHSRSAGVIEVLIYHEAKETSENPLNLACKFNQTDVAIKIRHEYGDHDIIGPDTALNHACQNGNVKLVEMLVDCILTESIGYTKSDLNLCSPLHTAVKKSHVEVVGIIVKAGANVNALDDSGLSPLHIAAIHVTDESLIEFLIHHGAYCDLPSPRGSTPLLLAVKNKNMQAVSTLLKFDASINKCDQYGYTPLMAACLIEEKCMSEAMLRYLIFNGHCNVDLTDNEGQSALTLCIRIEKNVIAEILAFEAGARFEFDDIRRSLLRFSINTTLRFLQQYVVQLLHCRSCFRSK